jgi:LacI family transcriptional regulator
MRQKIRIQDVAAAAGVSTQTISRVLNNKPDVAPETRQRILDTIQQLGYEPNLLARGLASNRTFTLGLVTYDFADPFFAAILSAAEREARDHNYFFLMTSSEFRFEDEGEILRLLVSRQVDGVLITSLGREAEANYILSLLDQGLPVVTISYFMSDPRMPNINVNNIEGGYKAGRHLLELGHRNIAMITGPLNNMATTERTNGFCKALEEAGVQLNPELVALGNWSYASGYPALRELLARNGGFSALFVHNDRMAIAAIEALREAGYRVPEDVSVIGYDDLPEAAFSNPPLTTIRQSAQDMGRTATRVLIDVIEKPDVEHPSITLSTELVVRQSTCSLVPQREN